MYVLHSYKILKTCYVILIGEVFATFMTEMATKEKWKRTMPESDYYMKVSKTKCSTSFPTTHCFVGLWKSSLNFDFIVNFLI